MRQDLYYRAQRETSGSKKIHPFRKNSETQSSLPPRVRNDAVCYFFQLPSFTPLYVFVFLSIARNAIFSGYFSVIFRSCVIKRVIAFPLSEGIHYSFLNTLFFNRSRIVRKYFTEIFTHRYVIISNKNKRISLFPSRRRWKHNY